MAGLLEKDQVGKREWLADTITIADAKEKPLLAMIPKGRKPVATLARWQADSYEAPNTGGVIDGKDVESFEDGAKNRQELKVYCQKVRRTAKVSEMAEDVSEVAGAPEGDLARSIDKKLEELGRDIEATLCSDNDTQADDGGKPYKNRGLGSWISSSAQSTLPVPAAFLTPAASLDSTAMASLTEDTFKGVLKSVYEQRGKSQELTLLVGTDLKTAITGFTQFRGSSTNTYGTIRAYNADLNGKKITSNITLYEGDFNSVRIVPSLLLASGTTNAPSRRGYVLDLDMLELCWAKKPQVKQLPDLDGGPRAVIKAIFCMKVKNPLAFGKFAATS
jgi:hypothetical protein